MARLKREGYELVNMPIYAKNIASYALQLSKETERGRTYSLITARVFTAFMLEGVLEHLGSILFHDWEMEREDGKPSLSRKPSLSKNKIIRRAIGLDNGNSEFNDTRILIEALVNFRHSLAHPKQLRVPINDEVLSGMEDQLVPIEWEANLTLKKIENEFREALQYCEKLLNTCHTLIKKEESENYLSYLKKYPHHEEEKISTKIDNLSCFFYTLGSSITSLSVVQEVA